MRRNDGEGWRRLHPATPVLRSLQLAIPLAIAISASLTWTPTRPVPGAPVDDDVSRLLVLALGAVLLVGLVSIVLGHLRFRYRVTSEGLVIWHGILFRERRAIPRSRIQNIDLTAGLPQRLLGVVVARIETAGGGASEASLAVISRHEAEQLRARLVPRHPPPSPSVELGPHAPIDAAEVELESPAGEPPSVPETPAAQQRAAAEPVIHRSSLLDLVIAGGTSNRAGVLVGAIFGGDFFLPFLPTDRLLARWLPPELLVPESAIGSLGRAAQHSLEAFVTAAAVLGITFAVAGWGLSVLASVVRYFDFTLTAVRGELEVDYGLLTRRQKGFRRVRIQQVQIEESILRRWFGLATVRVQTAGYGPGTRDEDRIEVLAPIARVADIGRYIGTVAPDLDWSAIDWRPSHPRARRRIFVRRAVPLVAASLVLTAIVGPWALALNLGLVPAWLLALAHYRHLGHAETGRFVLTREGFWNRRTFVVPVRKIQTLRLAQTPFQRRLRLGTLAIHTAGGSELSEAFGVEPRAVDVGDDYGRGLMLQLGQRVSATGLEF